jgi:TrmH family RNA methyltransferase
MIITSPTNQFVKTAASLRQKKGRLAQGLFLAEGPHLVAEALRAQAEIRQYFWTARLGACEAGQALLRRLAGMAEGFEVSEPVLAKLAETETPQGIVALVALPPEPALDLTGVQLAVVLDGLQDPGNVGAIIRTAWAAGLDGLLLTSGTADPFAGKVVRASMGGVFNQKIYRNLRPELIATAARAAGLQIVVGVPDATSVYFTVDLTRPTLIVVGNEGQGVAAQWADYAPCRVMIPQPGKANSLNVAVSLGILTYEALRQRWPNN